MKFENISVIPNTRCIYSKNTSLEIKDQCFIVKCEGREGEDCIFFDNNKFCFNDKNHSFSFQDGYYVIKFKTEQDYLQCKKKFKKCLNY